MLLNKSKSDCLKLFLLSFKKLKNLLDVIGNHLYRPILCLTRFKTQELFPNEYSLQTHRFVCSNNSVVISRTPARLN